MVNKKRIVWWVTAVAALACMLLGWRTNNVLCFGAGAAGLCYVVLRLCGWEPGRRRAPQRPSAAQPVEKAEAPPAHRTPSNDPNDIEALVEEMLAQRRYALLLRPQIVPSLTKEHLRQTLAALAQGMAVVPEGEVLVAEAAWNNDLDETEAPGSQGKVVRVAGYYLDRYPVTNREYQEFVSGGGYEQMAIWDSEIWPGVLDFVDRTGCPGPRDWKNGRHKPGEQNHPVVNVSWYEAAAYARWVGKRLPTNAEWVKAASWPIQLSATVRVQRKYPWGDSMDRLRANLWGSGPGRIVPVDEFPEGVSTGGVYQLIGNVWEWTNSNFGSGGDPRTDLILHVPMKSIRGGAFNTYFDHQAACQFQSGEIPVARKYNIGFRCALSLCDVAIPRADGGESELSAIEEETLAVEEAVT
ncbi:MAG: formylglycine-generating enzyme family protein [Pirellulales bacterium]